MTKPLKDGGELTNPADWISNIPGIERTGWCLLCRAPSDVLGCYIRDSQPKRLYWYGLCDWCANDPESPNKVEMIVNVNFCN